MEASKVATRWLEAKRPKYSAGHLYYCPDDDTVFLTRRSSMMHHPHLWDIPGGRSDKQDDSIEETAEREATEELTHLPTEALRAGYHAQTFKKDGMDYHYYVFLFRVSEAEKIRWTPLVQLNEESEGFKWFKLEELPKRNEMHFDLSWVHDIAEEVKQNTSKGRPKTAGRIHLASEVFRPRYEYKFWLPIERVAAVRDFIEPFAVADAHGPSYQIRNIYLDNSRLDLFTEHMRHQASHYKLRARTYNASDEVFLEVKRKERGVCSKSRNIVPAGMYGEILKQAQTQDHIPFLKLALERRSTPVVMIDYQREAYSVPGPEDGRITIDTNVRYGRHKSFSFAGKPQRLAFTNKMAVLELKFSGAQPQSMSRLIKAFDLDRASISKYCISVADMLRDGEIIPSYRRL